MGYGGFYPETNTRGDQCFTSAVYKAMIATKDWVDGNPVQHPVSGVGLLRAWRVLGEFDPLETRYSFQLEQLESDFSTAKIKDFMERWCREHLTGESVETDVLEELQCFEEMLESPPDPRTNGSTLHAPSPLSVEHRGQVSGCFDDVVPFLQDLKKRSEATVAEADGAWLRCEMMVCTILFGQFAQETREAFDDDYRQRVANRVTEWFQAGKGIPRKYKKEIGDMLDQEVTQFLEW